MTGKRTAVAGTARAVMAGAVFGYVEVFTKGIDRLPEKPCGGAVDRGLAADALPSARKAEERGKLTSPDDLFFSCYVRTDDSIVSGEVQAGRATEATWQEAHRSDREDGAVPVSAGEVKALALPTRARVYVPCAPRRTEAGAKERRCLTVRARTIGETRLHGTALRQVVAGFACQMARHAYEAGECGETIAFPGELPRLGSN
ncbi:MULTISPECIES: hypothetical protein [Streptomyces]|uniref:hypothetical protein n=1 Tax=Streptomyces TaxID=1883 RepID=UPI001266DAD9|nr:MULTISPECIES: hypothetical protein [Streptomyces]MBB4158276.1 hypothetical protein [Streptomyces cinereoruber]MBY8814232.1 hypothetical protein [Streptomyces cinereoruber]NIH58937.1 hypothetical protein [Streptomyces cinereoruber]